MDVPGDSRGNHVQEESAGGRLSDTRRAGERGLLALKTPSRETLILSSGLSHGEAV